MSILAPNTAGDIARLEMPATDQFRVGFQKSLANADNWSLKYRRVTPDTQKNIRVYIEANNLDFRFGVVGPSPTYKRIFLREYTKEVEQWSPEGIEIHQSELGVPSFDSWLFENVNNMGAAAGYLGHRRFVDMLIFGDTDPIWTTWDGAQLFSNSHTLNNGAAFDNLFAGFALTGANLQLIKTALMKAPTGPNGRPRAQILGAKFTLVVPLELEATARMILFNTVLPENSPISGSGATATENPYKGMMDLQVENTLTDANDYYVIMQDSLIQQPVMELWQKDMPANDKLNTPTFTDASFIADPTLRWNWQTYRVLEPVRFDYMAKATN